MLVNTDCQLDRSENILGDESGRVSESFWIALRWRAHTIVLSQESAFSSGEEVFSLLPDCGSNMAS